MQEVENGKRLKLFFLSLCVYFFSSAWHFMYVESLGEKKDTKTNQQGSIIISHDAMAFSMLWTENINSLALCHDYHILHTHIYSHWTYHHDVIREYKESSAQHRVVVGEEEKKVLRVLDNAWCLVVAVCGVECAHEMPWGEKACEENDTLRVLLSLHCQTT